MYNNTFKLDLCNYTINENGVFDADGEILVSVPIIPVSKCLMKDNTQLIGIRKIYGENKVEVFVPLKNLEDAKRLSKLFQKIYFCNKPVITLVHGAVIGGGNGITAASDIVLAEENTVFAFSEVKLGLTPATISPFVMARCGEAPARDLMLSGRKFTAQEARDYKLVNFVGDIDELNKKLDAYIDDFLKASPDAIRDCKHLIRNVGGISNPYSSVFDMTAQLIAQERMSDDAQERMRG